MRRRSRLFPSLGCLSLLCLFCLCAVPVFAAAEAGRVVSITPGAFVERGGKTLPLALKSAIESGDTLSTDASGRVRVLFSDDSSMTLGPNTALALREYMASGSKPAFKAHMAKGLLRSITGKIVESNPEGFALTTPEATVGIRGTIISMRSERGSTTVYVENTTRKVYVNNINVPGGKKITVPGEPSKTLPIEPEDRRRLGREFAFLGGAGTAASAPEPSRAAGKQEATTLLTADDGLRMPESDLAGLALPSDMRAEQLRQNTGTVTGSLHTSGAGTFAGTFGFVVDLGSGAISSGYMRGSGTISGPVSNVINFTGGTGSAGPASFTVSGFGGAGTQTSPINGSVALTPGMISGSMLTGPGGLTSMPGGSNFPVNYSIPGPAPDAGNGSGTLKLP